MKTLRISIPLEPDFTREVDKYARAAKKNRVRDLLKEKLNQLKREALTQELREGYKRSVNLNAKMAEEWHEGEKEALGLYKKRRKSKSELSLTY